MIRETWALTVRELKHWYRVKIQIFMTLIQPIVWLGLFGQAFQINKLIPSVPGAPAGLFAMNFGGATDYFSFMSVGMLAVITLFTCMFSGMSIVWDRRFGFLTKLKVAPIPRGAIPLSRIMATVVRAMIQVGIVFAIAIAFTYVPGLVGLTVGAGFDLMGLLGLLLAMFLLSIGFSALFTTIALAVENQETLFGVINLLNLPLMFASAALFPLALMPDWLKTVAEYNPLTWAVDAARQFVFQNPNPIWPLWLDMLGLVIFSAILGGISIVVSRKLLGNK
jgi:ABC-2 type transport system permease protein